MKVAELNVTDGQIIEFSVQSDVVTVQLEDWQAQGYTVIFKGVVGLEAYSPQGVDLCHIKVLSESEQINKVCAIVQEDGHQFNQYVFIGAWGDQAVLSLVCEDVEVSKYDTE